MKISELLESDSSRREFIKKSGVIGLAGLSRNSESKPFGHASRSEIDKMTGKLKEKGKYSTVMSDESNAILEINWPNSKNPGFILTPIPREIIDIRSDKYGMPFALGRIKIQGKVENISFRLLNENYMEPTSVFVIDPNISKKILKSSGELLIEIPIYKRGNKIYKFTLEQDEITKNFFEQSEDGSKKNTNISNLPSIDDEPEDDRGDNDDLEGDSDREDGPTDAAIQDFKSIAGDMGDGLWSAIAFNILDDFANVKRVYSVINKIDNFGDPAIDNYIENNSDYIADNKVVSVVIFNEKTGQVVEFNSGVGVNDFEQQPVDLTPGQRNILNNVLKKGQAYSRAVGRVEWPAGGSIRPAGARDRVYRHLDELSDALALNQLVDKPVKISAAQKKKNAEMSDRIFKLAREKFLARKAQRELKK